MKPELLHWGCVVPRLKATLESLMKEKMFNPFRLVGGTNISLLYGHRQSDDIDLFTDADYGSLDFDLFEQWLSEKYPYFDKVDKSSIVGMGRSYYIGDDDTNCVKLDLIYTDGFSKPINVHGIHRFADIEDIIAMKLLVIQDGGRKKDFWDIHLLLDYYDLGRMLRFFEQRSPLLYDKSQLLSQFINFEKANEDPDPICRLYKNWDDIKLDFIELLSRF